MTSNAPFNVDSSDSSEDEEDLPHVPTTSARPIVPQIAPQGDDAGRTFKFFCPFAIRPQERHRDGTEKKTGKKYKFNPSDPEKKKIRKAARKEWNKTGQKAFKTGVGLKVSIVNRFARPKGHFNKNGAILARFATKVPAGKGDVDNVLKLCLDCTLHLPSSRSHIVQENTEAAYLC